MPRTFEQLPYLYIPDTMTSESAQTFQRPEFPEYAIERIRLRSFDDWPTVMRQTPEQMADAGYFYTQISDRVICYSCGGGLCKWAEYDDPWEQHALWYRNCNYLQLVKGPEFIATVEKKYGIRQKEKKNTSEDSNSTSPSTSPSPSTSTSTSTSTPQQEDGQGNSTSKEQSSDPLPPKDIKTDETTTNDARLCKICFLNEYNTVFIPCGHILACAKCAATQKDCPLCRKKFKSIHRIFLP